MTTTIEYYTNSLRENSRLISCLSAAKKRLKEGLVENHAPHKVGDVLTIKGYSHTGKKGRVVSISVRDDLEDGYEWIIRAAVLRKDGSEGFHRAKWHIPIKNG